MNQCTEEKLFLFSREHYTYINQIFGDETIRQIIKEMYTERELDFGVEDANEDFEYSNHHVLVKHNKRGDVVKWCSVDEGLQNVFKNKNDTLCQSYTLMKYLNKPIVTNMKKRQMDMIRMYRNIMKREFFQDELKGVVELMQKKIRKRKTATRKKKNTVRHLWKDYTNEPTTYLHKNYDTVYAEINSVLDTWENYGYLFFTKDGKCDKK